jgi:acetoin utilization protein AcuB
MKEDDLVGIISDRDLKKASPSDASTLDIHEMLYLVSKIKVKEIMNPEPFTVSPDFTVEEAAEILLEKKISSLPVIDERRRLVGIITRSDIFRMLISVTGLGKKGVQIAVQLEDRPGMIDEVRELIRKYKARTTSILSSAEESPHGYRNIYFRIYNIDRQYFQSLIKEIEGKGTLLYVADHRQGDRKIYHN